MVLFEIQQWCWALKWKPKFLNKRDLPNTFPTIKKITVNWYKINDFRKKYQHNITLLKQKIKHYIIINITFSASLFLSFIFIIYGINGYWKISFIQALFKFHRQQGKTCNNYEFATENNSHTFNMLAGYSFRSTKRTIKI